MNSEEIISLINIETTRLKEKISSKIDIYRKKLDSVEGNYESKCNENITNFKKYFKTFQIIKIL